MSVSTLPSKRDLWTLRLLYIFWMGGNGAFFPFLNLYLKRQGLDGVEIGWIASIGAMVALLAAPVWARWSSRSTRPLLLVQLSFFLSGALAVVISWQSAFIWLAIVAALRVLVTAGAAPLLESISVRITESLGLGYGSVRVFGSLGWAVVVLGAGWLIQNAGIRSTFYLFFATTLVCAVLLSTLKGAAGSAYRPVQTASSLDKKVGMRELLRHPGLLGLALAMFLTTLGNIGVLQFENIYLDQLGAPEALIGVASMVSSVVEVPGMLLADRLVRRHQAGPVLLLGMLIFAAARVGIFVFPSVVTVMISKGVAGLAFSFFTIAMIKYVSQRTQGSETATALALLSVTLPSLLNIAGTPLVGYVFDLAGARWLYAFAAAGYLLGSLVLHLNQRAGAPKSGLNPA